jgi:outer membrane lipoprotein
MRFHAVWFVPLAVASLLLSGCATTFDVGTADRSVTPRAAVDNVAAVRDRSVAWGGIIVAAKNLKEHTELEVLAYPLDNNNRPKRNGEPLGRFIAVHSGYLETADYAAGREITTVGTVTATRAGTVGEAAYVYPLLATSRVYLWPKESAYRSEPSVHFGIGVGIIK